MRVFVTGATGFVGTAIVQDLLAAGHQVTGLARSGEAAATLKIAGASVHWGNLEDLDSLAKGAAAADGVIHAAFNHDFSAYKEHCENDGRVIEALGAALAGTRKPLIVTSGIGILPAGAGTILSEDQLPASGDSAHPRAASEWAAERLRQRGVQASILRLPPSVHGAGDHGFVPLLIKLAREKGAVAYAGDGGNRWPAVYRHDAARLYRLALEHGAAHPRYHGVAETGVPFRDIAALIGRRLGLPVISLQPNGAAAHFGWFAHFAQMDVPATSATTQAALGWRPTGPGLLVDLDQRAYFAG